MSYSACDFLENCEQLAEQYGVPQVTREHWNTLGIDDEPIPEEDWQDYCNGERGQLVLAERIGRALNTRGQLLAALQGLLAAAEGAGNAWDAMNVAREAIKEATA